MSLALKHQMKKRAKKMAEGGEVPKPKPTASPKNDIPEPNKKAAEEFVKGFNSGGPGPKDWVKNIKQGLGIANYADGGEVEMDMIGELMHKRKMMSEGGQVANDTPAIAGSEENQFDDLVLRDDLEMSYDGANSGDELGNAQLNDDTADIIARVMSSRRKKDKMPHPA